MFTFICAYCGKEFSSKKPKRKFCGVFCSDVRIRNFRASEWGTQNQIRKKQRRPKSSRYKGVCLEHKTGKWRARIHRGKKQVHLGNFSYEEDAARAYDREALIKFGEFAMINFPTHGGISCLS